MAYGLQVRNVNGNITLDATDRITRYLGETYEDSETLDGNTSKTYSAPSGWASSSCGATLIAPRGVSNSKLPWKIVENSSSVTVHRNENSNARSTFSIIWYCFR